LKTQQHATSRSTLFLGESSHRTAYSPSTGSAPTGVRAPAFPRKEVIQPQLPLRLPCYDFTPIINPTFDGSLPCGLGHRLRVLPTFVVSRAVCTRPGNIFTAALLIRDYYQLRLHGRECQRPIPT